jgi:membrane protease YdiL (CAAX protease family)
MADGNARAQSGAAIPDGNGIGYDLLPRDASFAQSLPAFLLPYVAYVGIGSSLSSLLDPGILASVRFAAVAGLLWYFRKRYRFGPPLTFRQFLIACGGAIAALALWVLAYRFSLALPWWRPHLASAAAAELTTGYWIGRAVNSALLVPIFEELFCRAYVGEFLAGMQGSNRAPGPNGAAAGIAARLGDRMDAHPEALSTPPLSRFAILGATAVFTIGHDVSAWPAAILYFLFTTWLYARTRSFKVCMIVHGLVNLAIACLVLANPALRFLWF